MRKIIFLVLMSIFGFVSLSFAHHIRGLPHYGYSENYPQIPTYEEIRIVDDWRMNFFFIRIFETNSCDLAVYLKNVHDGKPFNGTVSFTVFGERENPDEAHSFNAQLDPTNTFRVGWVYEIDGIYILRIKFNDGKKDYVEDFRMQMGKVGFNWFWIILPGSVVLILILLIISKRIKEGKKS